VKRAKNILLHFLLISLTFGFLGVRPVSAAFMTGDIIIYQERTVEEESVKCNVIGSCIEAGSPIYAYADNIRNEETGELKKQGTVNIYLNVLDKAFGGQTRSVSVSNGKSETATFDAKKIDEGKKFEIVVSGPVPGNGGAGEYFSISETSAAQASCDELSCNTDLSAVNPYKLCSQIDKSKEEYLRCVKCFSDMEGIWTAVGCIPQDPTSAVASIVQIGLGIAGGIVLIMILVGAFMFSTSQGDPNKTKEAKEIITSAIIGLIFVIFSVTMLQFIGVNILQIPGFGQ
jgi:hypothetical protein